MTSPSLQRSGSRARRRLLALLSGCALGLLAVGAVLWLASQRAPLAYVVVRGDTLSRIAGEHGVTVQQLRDWNGIQGDLIEVGQRLVIHGELGAEVVGSRDGRGRSRSRGEEGQAPPTGPGLALPPEKPCLPPPDASALDDLEGDEPVMIASRGLSKEQVDAAMRPFLPRLFDCVGDGMQPDGVSSFELVVACTGRVERVRVVDDGGLPPALVGCSSDMLRYVGFPAHDLPDGQEIGYPVSFSW